MGILLIVATIIMGILSTSSFAHDFTFCWVQNPKESFNSWASKMRFQVNDNLGFKCNQPEDSVLVVKKEDYDSCNVKNPIQKLEGSDSTFTLTRSGPFYFISSVEEKCSKGEKMEVVVLSERNEKSPIVPKPPTSSSPPSSSPLPPTSSSSPSPPTSMAPSVSPSSSSSTPPSVSPPPPLAPSVAPSTSSSSMAPSTSPPSMAPSVSSSPSSSMPPSVSSSPASSSMAPTNSESPSASNLTSPAQAPSSINEGGGGNAKSSASALIASSVTMMMTGAISIVLIN